MRFNQIIEDSCKAYFGLGANKLMHETFFLRLTALNLELHLPLGMIHFLRSRRQVRDCMIYSSKFNKCWS